MLAARSRRARSTARGDASREQILEAAVDVLRERGYAGLSISAVCERADIAPTSVYWHFGSKAGLMEAVVDRIGGGHTRRIRASVARREGNSLERLDRLVAALRELVTTQPLGSLTGVALVSEGRHATPELREALRDARRREFELVAADFEAELGEAAHYGHILAVLVMACTNYAALTYRIEREESEVDRILAALREVILLVARTKPG